MNQIKAGAILSYLQTGLNVIITLLYTPVMIRLLGTSEYGLYNTVASVISIISLLNMGFSSTYIRFYTRYDAQREKHAIMKLNGMFLEIFAVIAIVAAGCGLFLSEHLQIVFSDGLTVEEYVIAKRLMVLLSANLAVSLFSNVFSCIITAHEKFVVLKLVGLIRLVVSPLVTIPILLAGYGSVGMVLVMVALSCVTDLIYAAYVLFRLKERFVFREFDMTLFQEVFSFTLLIAIHLIVDQINWNVDKILLGRFKGTQTVALYSVGYSLYMHYMAIGLTMVSVFAPRVHKIVTEYKEDRLQLTDHLTAIFTSIGRIQYLIMAPVVVGFVFWGREFIAYWAGAEYTDAYYVALLLMIPGSIDIIQNIGIEIQRAEGLHRFRAVIYAVMAVINVLISIVLCQKYGAVGCAIGTAISLIVVQGFVINIYYHKKCCINILHFWKSILQVSKGLILPICFGSVVRLIKVEYSILELVVCIGCFVVVYAVSMYTFGMRKEEKESVRRVVYKLKHARE